MVYRVSCGPHQQTGVVLEVPVEYYRAGRIKPHEATAADRERRLLLFTETTRARPIQAALASAGAFAVGALPPVLLVLFLPLALLLTQML